MDQLCGVAGSQGGGTPGAPTERSRTHLRALLEHLRKEQSTSQFEGAPLLFQGKEKDVNKRPIRGLRGNQGSVTMETKVVKETFKKLEQLPVFPT